MDFLDRVQTSLYDAMDVPRPNLVGYRLRDMALRVFPQFRNGSLPIFREWLLDFIEHFSRAGDTARNRAA